MTREELEDFKARHDAIAYAQTYSLAFCEKYKEELALLITTYADEDARELLETLRERFYLREWEQPHPENIRGEKPSVHST